jgi:hypothetical protein
MISLHVAATTRGRAQHVRLRMTWDKLTKGSRPRHMPKKTLLFALALLTPTLPRAEAAAFACSGPIPDLECLDRELVGLDRAVDTEFDAIIRRALIR